MQIYTQDKPETKLKDKFADSLASPLLNKEIIKQKYLSYNNSQIRQEYSSYKLQSIYIFKNLIFKLSELTNPLY